MRRRWGRGVLSISRRASIGMMRGPDLAVREGTRTGRRERTGRGRGRGVGKPIKEGKVGKVEPGRGMMNPEKERNGIEETRGGIAMSEDTRGGTRTPEPGAGRGMTGQGRGGDRGEPLPSDKLSSLSRTSTPVLTGLVLVCSHSPSFSPICMCTVLSLRTKLPHATTPGERAPPPALAPMTSREKRKAESKFEGGPGVGVKTGATGKRCGFAGRCLVTLCRVMACRSRCVVQSPPAWSVEPMVGDMAMWLCMECGCQMCQRCDETRLCCCDYVSLFHGITARP